MANFQIQNTQYNNVTPLLIALGADKEPNPNPYPVAFPNWVIEKVGTGFPQRIIEIGPYTSRNIIIYGSFNYEYTDNAPLIFTASIIKSNTPDFLTSVPISDNTPFVTTLETGGFRTCTMTYFDIQNIIYPVYYAILIPQSGSFIFTNITLSVLILS